MRRGNVCRRIGTGVVGFAAYVALEFLNDLHHVVRHKRLVNALSAEFTPALSGEYKIAGGRKAVPALQLLAERFLSKEYAPESVAETTGVPAGTIKRIIRKRIFRPERALDLQVGGES